MTLQAIISIASTRSREPKSGDTSSWNLSVDVAVDDALVDYIAKRKETLTAKA